jgi:outer membrane protein OmpA-like peptidoglycan-associated protein
LALLEEVVTKDMDGLSLVINQNHSFEDGPTPFDYSLLRDQKYYKPDIFANKEADFNLKELTSSPKSKRFAYKLSYWRIGLHCIDVDVTLRDDSFDVVAFQDSVNKELGISQDLAGSALDLVWNGDFGIDTTNKRIKNVTIQIPFRKGKANYKAKDLIEMMDTLVERGFKINAAHVTAYSSVEGDYELNAKLARKRGKNVVEALRELNGGALFYGKLVTNDSWDNFYKTVGESPHPEFKDMSKDEIKAQLRPGMASTKDMEAFLSAQRYAEIQLSLEYLSQEAQDEKQAEFREIRNIYYDFGKFYVRKEAGRSLDVFSRLLKQQPEFNLIELGAHTDSRGSYAFNEKLSKRRAQSVVDYLISKGIDRSRLVPKGYGESELLNHCKDGVECSEAEHQRNRRTTFRILNEGQEIKSVEPDDISVDYAPSFRPTDGLIDLESELAAELAKKNGVGASRVYKKMIKRVMLGQMPADILNVSAEIPADVNHLDFKLHILLAKVVLLQESEGIMEAFDQIIQIDPTAPFVVYNAMAYKLLKDQGFVAALKADASKKVQVVGILNSIRESKFPTDKLDRLISFVNSL